MKVYSDTIVMEDGCAFSRRWLLTDEEAETMRLLGIVSEDFAELIGMEHVADLALKAIEIGARQ